MTIIRSRFWIGAALAGFLGLMIVPALGADRKKRSAEEKKLEELDDLTRRLNRLAADAGLVDEQRFLHDRIGELLQAARETPGDSYLFGRLDAAIDDLLDASDELRDARRPRNNDDDDGDKDKDRERTAHELEQTYFRVTQGEYFARQSRDAHGNDYVRTAQRLYQQARAAYDAREYGRARHLADAAQEVIEGLENLAQAAVRIPEPPKL
jgi:hypothetical protein